MAENLWRRTFRDGADVGSGFLENGGGSFRVVLPSGWIYEPAC